MRTWNLAAGLFYLTVTACFACLGMTAEPLSAWWAAATFSAAVHGAKAGRRLGLAVLGDEQV